MVPLTGLQGAATIDTLFCEVVEPGSIIVTGVVLDAPTACGAYAEPDSQGTSWRVVVQIAQAPRLPSLATVSLRGVRKGHEQRFRRFSLEQMQRNTAFWSAAYE